MFIYLFCFLASYFNYFTDLNQHREQMICFSAHRDQFADSNKTDGIWVL